MVIISNASLVSGWRRFGGYHQVASGARASLFGVGHRPAIDRGPAEEDDQLGVRLRTGRAVTAKMGVDAHNKLLYAWQARPIGRCARDRKI